MIRDSEVGLQL